MTFLIVKILVYLIVAAGIGAGGGWLLRNLQAQKSEESAQRAMNDAKSKLPQLESLLRGRDEQIKKLKGEIGEARSTLSSQSSELKASEQKLREQERELQRLQQSAKAPGASDLDDLDYEAIDEGGDADDLIAELSQEIARLKAELAAGAGRDTATASSGDEASLLAVEKDALQLQLDNAERSLELALADLRSEQDKVRELERERELQNKSIHVLHQQLEMERSRRAANG